MHISLEELNGFPIQLLNRYNHAFQSEPGRRIRERLVQDPRVQKLQGKWISGGGGHGIFQLPNLGYWYLWLEEQRGTAAADLALETFLNATELETYHTLWITGIEIESTVTLSTEVELVPWQQLPLSRETEHLRTHQSPARPFPYALPRAALVLKKNVPKIYVSDAAGRTEAESNSDPQDHLYQTAFLMNALDGVCVQPVSYSVYHPLQTPFGPFGGSMAGGPIFDVNLSDGKLSGDIDVALLQKLSAARAATPFPHRFDFILRRLAQAKRRSDTSDKLLDLGIVLEMLLLGGGKQRDITRKFRSRGAFLMGSTGAEKKKYAGQMNRLYDLRSRAAHDGFVDKKELPRLVTEMPDFERIACAICRRILVGGEPDWKKLKL